MNNSHTNLIKCFPVTEILKVTFTQILRANNHLGYPTTQTTYVTVMVSHRQAAQLHHASHITPPPQKRGERKHD